MAGIQLGLFGEAHRPLARAAALSECGEFRWWLSREWGDGPAILWAMLNPSLADDSRDDPTLLRIMSFSRRWGYGGLRVVNLHPYRSPHPSELAAWLARGVGVGAAAARNAEAVTAMCAQCQGAVVAWGAGGSPEHQEPVLEAIRLGGLRPSCIGRTASGAPKHPLARGRSRVPDDAVPIPYAA